MDILLLTSLFIFFLISGLYWFLPYITPKSVQFGVRMPRSREADPAIHAVRRRFHMLLLAVSVPTFVLLIILPAVLKLYWITMLSMAADMVLTYLAYFSSFRKLRALKESGEWYRDVRESIGAAYPEEAGEGSKVLTILTMVPAIAIVALTFYIGIGVYPNLPSVFATHFGANGQPNGYSAKSIGTVFMVPFIQAGITAMMFLIGYAISRTRQEIDVSRPITTADQQERFKVYVRDSLFLFTALIDLTMMMTSLAVWGILPPDSVLVLTLLPVLVGAIVLSAVLMSFGQMGSRLDVPELKGENTGKVNRNDDRYWKGGALYYTPKDPAILVGKRFGVGWTFNFGHRVTWAVFAAIILVPVLIALFSTHLI
ncbi:hypothetical protein IX51_01455 [uncultured archaeon]|nr:hypothetical protein IX51_01455 [uncultured archaeon]